jgi:prepilin-type N-terminal cleavage/methylation domain-containing protein
MCRSLRVAFTLIESLVAIAIIAIVLCLSLTAIQKVREASNRLKCSNNFRQIGSAFQAHHKTRGHFPRGGNNAPPAYMRSADISATTPTERELTWSWAYQILPFMEQDAIFQNPNPAVVRATPIKSYHCPSRRRAEAIDGLAKMDYAGNAGDHPEGRNGLVMRSTHGVVRIEDVIDGASTTVMVGEKQLNRAMFGQSIDDSESYSTSGWNEDWGAYRWGAAAPAADTEAPGETGPSTAFGSAHACGFYCVFVDGSVRFIRYTVPPTIWRRACVRDDNQSFNPNNL